MPEPWTQVLADVPRALDWPRVCPNKDFDPVAPHALSEESVNEAVAAALAAIAGAADLDGLKQVRAGSCRRPVPLALANREIGAAAGCEGRGGCWSARPGSG